MEEMNKLLQYCAERYEQINCVKCAYNQTFSQACNHECYSCLFKVHRVHNHSEHYYCERMLHRYVLKFQIRYASEMVRCFWYIFKEQNIKSPITVFSLGCGPASELYGLFRIARYLSIPAENIIYKGFDIDNKWRTINELSQYSFSGYNVEFIYSDMFQYVSDNDINIDILVLNYVLSDCMRYDKSKASTIIDNLYQMIVSEKLQSIVINDIALFYTDEERKSAYTCMLELEKRLVENKIPVSITKKRFSEPKTTTVEPYGDLSKQNSIMFTIPENILRYGPFSLCDSIILIIQKKQSHDTKCKS